MKITFLGTGTSQGVPVIACNCEICTSTDFRDQRLRTSVMVESQGVKIVIDTGPDFRQQMLREKVQDIDAVLYTHEHNDHIAGLDDLRSFNYVKKGPVDIYAERRVDKVIQKAFPYIFATDKYPGVPKLKIHEIENNAFYVRNLKIEPVRILHYKLPVLGFKIDRMAYLTDVSHIAIEEMEKLFGLEILILDALRIEPHISHFNLQQALDVVGKVQPKKAYFVHISHKLGLHREIQAQLPPNVFLAYDSLKICYT